jgi:hypothetical protein
MTQTLNEPSTVLQWRPWKWRVDYTVLYCIVLCCIVLYCVCSICCFYSVCSVVQWQVSCPTVARQNYGPTKWYKYVCMYVGVLSMARLQVSLTFVLLPVTACFRSTASAVSRGFSLPHCIGEAKFRICVSHFNCSWRQCLQAQQECVATCLRRRRLRMEECDVELIAW